jgi:hypothetical protein
MQRQPKFPAVRRRRETRDKTGCNRCSRRLEANPPRPLAKALDTSGL